ncbi:type II toxin-antitoxin system PemK/MazF family toxin [Streptacidiphilus sp. 4-A2]|nr:type II toxin-antitoxin system PemK/MazF family toxin [Streptacidiphilus sp. 4-A2]
MAHYGIAALLVLIALIVLLVLGALRRRRSGRPGSRPAGPAGSRPAGAPGRLPEPREIWWAEVPFEDGPGSKDRPCLVLRRGPRTVTVLKITSKHHAELPGVIELPPGTVDDQEHRASWLETEESREVPPAGFRRRVGVVDPQLWARVRKARAGAR